MKIVHSFNRTVVIIYYNEKSLAIHPLCSNIKLFPEKESILWVIFFLTSCQ